MENQRKQMAKKNEKKQELMAQKAAQKEANDAENERIRQQKAADTRMREQMREDRLENEKMKRLQDGWRKLLSKIPSKSQWNSWNSFQIHLILHFSIFFLGLLNGKKEMARRQMTKQQAFECEEAKRNRSTQNLFLQNRSNFNHFLVKTIRIVSISTIFSICFKKF